jgi:voltage-gated potassium channel Kch
MTSRRRGEREWNRVMASTYRDHVVLCGLGHLGLRVLEEMRRREVEVVAIERDPAGRFVPAAKALGVPVLAADMRDDRVLEDAGIRHAKAVVVATNDDMANLEVALDARRMNPSIRVLVRFYDQQIATKIQGAFGIDEAFSSAALAAPGIVERAIAARAP